MRLRETLDEDAEPYVGQIEPITYEQFLEDSGVFEDEDDDAADGS